MFFPSQQYLYSLFPLRVWNSESYPVLVCLSGDFCPGQPFLYSLFPLCVLVRYSESYLAFLGLSGAVCPSQQFFFPLCQWYSESYFTLLNKLLAEATNDTVS